MKKYQFIFFSEAIGFTSTHIGEVRKEIQKRVNREMAQSVKHDIELQMTDNSDGIRKVLTSCYLYNDSFEMIHRSIRETKNYLKESWEYHVNHHSPNNQEI